MNRIIALGVFIASSQISLASFPQYTITDLGLVNPSHSESYGYGISPGGIAFGRSIGSPTLGFTQTTGSDLVGLPNHPSRNFGAALGANDSGLVVGLGATNIVLGNALPLIWNGGVVSQLPLPSSATVGRATDVNGSGTAVGSVGVSTSEIAAYWSGGSVNRITATTQSGASMVTALRINDSGLIVGVGKDPQSTARQVPFIYDTFTATLTEIPTLPSRNGGIARDVSQNGFVVGDSSQNQSSPLPFIWSAESGTVEIPLPPGATSGRARGVNSNGWVVGEGNGSLGFMPFLYDGTQTYLLQDLIPAGSGYSGLTANGISEDGSIVGTGLFNGATRAYRMDLVPEPGMFGMLSLAGIAMMCRRRC